MDKQLSGLDPKIQEKYQRVMNTTVPTAPPSVQPVSPSQAVPQAPPAAPAPEVPPVQAPTQPVTPPTPATDPSFQAPAAEIPAVDATQTPAVNVENSQVFSSKGKAGKGSPVIKILGILVFFIVYALVWVKIFGVSIPFLP